jgi:hypothetical protein
MSRARQLADLLDSNGKVANADLDTSLQNTITTALPKAGGTMTGDLALGDNVKAKFGASDDLQIYHDGSHSIIEEAGTGAIKIKVGDFRVENANGSNLIKGVGDVASLHHAGSTKLATTSSGVDISGTVTADGLVVDGGGSDPAQFTLKQTSNTTGLVLRNYAGSEAQIRNEDNGPLVFKTNGNEAFRVDSSGNVGIGTSSPSSYWASADDLVVSTSGNTGISVVSGTSSLGYLMFADGTSGGNNTRGGIGYDHSTNDMLFRVNNDSKMRIDSSGNVGIGCSPSFPLDVNGAIKSRTQGFRVGDGSTTAGALIMHKEITGAGTDKSVCLFAETGNELSFMTNGSVTERMRIDSSGNVLVGGTSYEGSATTGASSAYIASGGFIAASVTNDFGMLVNRTDSDGTLFQFRKNGSNVGSITTWDGELAIGRLNCALLFDDDTNRIKPHSVQSNIVRDNNLDLGGPSARFDDIYATNGTIQTSDRNEKQDIEELSEAEQRVAIACKGLMRKFRWKSAVEEKGDDARIHFGIIAQDLQAAFEAEGLDAGRYAMFISTTWWEADRIIPAVEAVEAQDAVYEEVVIPAVLDEDGNEVEPERTEQNLISEAVEAVKAVEEHTVTDTFETLEEAPEGATERTRMGVRYSELLAFIIGAI